MKRTPRTGWRRAASLALASAVWGAVAAVLVLGFFAYDLPDVERAFRPTRAPSVVVLAADGTELARVGEIWGRPVPLPEMAPELALAVIAYYGLSRIIFTLKLAFIPDLSFRGETSLRIFLYSIPWVIVASFFDLAIYKVYLRLKSLSESLHS